MYRKAQEKTTDIYFKNLCSIYIYVFFFPPAQSYLKAGVMLFLSFLVSPCGYLAQRLAYVVY